MIESSKNSLLDSIVTVACKVSRTVLEPLCLALEKLPAESTFAQRRALAGQIPSHETRQQILALFDLWGERYKDTSPTTIAWAIRAASSVDVQHRQQQTLELVWTGPNPAKTPLRRIDQVLLALLDNAQKSLLLVTYTSYAVPHIREGLLRACHRGVCVTLVIDSQEKEGEKPGLEPIAVFGAELVEKANVYVWPLANRERDEKGRPGVLHVKCAIADQQEMLLSSANLTGFAMTMNMELGLFVRGSSLPEQVYQHFSTLLKQGILERVR